MEGILTKKQILAMKPADERYGFVKLKGDEYALSLIHPGQGHVPIIYLQMEPEVAMTMFLDLIAQLRHLESH